MDQLSLGIAALLFPGVLILAGLVTALRRQVPPTPYQTTGFFVGLGVASVVLGVAWTVAAYLLLLGRVDINFYYAVLTAALPEEGFRYLLIRWGLARRPRTGPWVAMLLGGLFGLIFGVFEHVIYAVEKGWALWLARSFTSVPYHTLSGAALGGGIALAARTGRPWGLGVLAVLVTAHGLADWPLQGPDSPLPETAWEKFVSAGWVGNIGSLVVVVVLVTILARAVRTPRDDSPGVPD